MKIEINFDLLDKAREAKTGFSLNRTVRYVIPRTIAASAGYAALELATSASPEKILNGVPIFLLLYGAPFLIANGMLYKRWKDLSIRELRILSKLLSDININTSYELLLDSENYKTEYKLKFDESKIPYIKQDKYINIPVYNDGDIKEVSLVQEHVIGSKKYSLSYGSPSKVLKPAFNPI